MKTFIKVAMVSIILITMAGCEMFPGANADPWAVKEGMTKSEVLDAMDGMWPDSRTESSGGRELWVYRGEWSTHYFHFRDGFVDSISRYYH